MPQCGKGSPADGSPQRVIGVDGCSAGWFFIALEPSVGDVWRIGGWGIVCHFSCLVGGASRPAWIFVDLPIGLPDQVKEGRQCDKCARKVLGVRRNSVFPAPARYLLKASDFPEAKSLSDGAKDKAPSIQAFSILPKIREVDCLLRRDPKLKKIVREVHPEVCFWAFNGRRPMKHAKKGKNKEDRKGFEERIQVLERIRPSAGEEIDGMLKATRRNQVARDDIVDAFAAALTATAPEPVTLPPAPPDPPKDGEGLPMEMVYAEPGMIPGR